ncbi:MAG: diphthine synthase [Candidatus Woesearchaeota archaeon]|nr:diphthine synthase [Candidatus Woesearchaeota archaeon]
MALYFIGLGLNDEKDVSVKGLEIIKKADFIYLEDYTSKLNIPIEILEKFYNKKITLATREIVEKKPDAILNNAKTKTIAFLVAGDPFAATTHIDLYLRARKENIKCYVIHNASALTSIAMTGLQLYKFGKTTSIPFGNENVESPYDVLKENRSINAHTLFLLDLRPDENKFMSINDAIRYLLKVELRRNEKVFSEKNLCVGCVKLGSLDQEIKSGAAKELMNYKFKEGLQCLIVPSKMHFMEEEMIESFR